MRDSLFLNLFVASELNWAKKDILLRQETNFPYEEFTRLIITKGSSQFVLMIRYPSWVKDGDLKITVNGNPVSFNEHPSSYISIDRKWKEGDEVLVTFPMHTSVEQLPNIPDYLAFFHGPVLLGAKTGTEDLKGLIADDSRWGHIASGERLPVDEAPAIINTNKNDITEMIIPVQDKPLIFTLPSSVLNSGDDMILEPFYRIHDSRYIIYWKILTNGK